MSVNPQNVDSPRGRLTNGPRVIHDGQTAQGEWAGWSVAEFDWDDEPAIGVRWDGDAGPFVGLGYPTSHNQATWYVLPPKLGDIVRDAIKDYKQQSQRDPTK